MKQNDDGKTVRAMDVLFPKIGEIIGGSEREADYDKLMNRVNELEMSIESIWWYLESRKFGTAPHSGFGLGFERLMLFVTGDDQYSRCDSFSSNTQECRILIE